jgi:hypothetical protein
MDWQTWHDEYDRPDSNLARRLQAVQTNIRAALDTSPPGPLQVVSLCAGQGRDLLEVLTDHPRRGDIRARLVELDGRNSAVAAERVRAAGLDQVEVVTADASLTDNYRDLVPADLVLVCGIFGNILDADIERTIETCTQLCRNGGTVIWTRHRHAPDRVPQICDWFAAREFELQWLSDPDAGFGVGVHRFAGEPRKLAVGSRMFTFAGYDVLLKQADAQVTAESVAEADAQSEASDGSS